MGSARHQKGFIALISAIIIAAILLLAVVSSGFASFYSRFNILDSTLKARSESTADACADTAMLQIAMGGDPSGTVLTLNALDECRIGAVSTIAGPPEQKSFTVQATSSNVAVTNLKVVVETDFLDVVSWQEIAVF